MQHQTHSVQHPLHRLPKQALRVVARVSFHPLVRQQSRQLLAYFAAVPDTAEPLLPPRRYNRQTIAYRAVATMAHQIVRAHFPHVYQGQRRQGLAMMLDMNVIFEEFVYQRLRRLAVTRDFAVHRQRSRPLWGTSKVRPDIVVELPDGRGNVVIDTKWKILKRPRPAAEDLHQIYVYNQLFAARKGVLLYPQVYNLSAQKRRFDGPGVWLRRGKLLTNRRRAAGGITSEVG